MTAEIPKPAEIRQTRGYLWRRIISKWPLIVWLGVALLAYQLHLRGVRFERMNGVVTAETEIISALEDGVIAEMGITESGEPVDAGQVVVRIDDRMARGELEQTKQEIDADALDQERKTSTMKTSVNSDIAKMKLEKAGDESRLDALERGLVDLKQRRADNLIPQSQIDEVELEISTLRASLPFYSTRLTELEAELEKADELLARIKESREEEPIVLQLYRDRIARMELKSLGGGSVSQIYFRKGAVVRRGEPIVEIINMQSRGARGFILEGDADKVSVGMAIYISPTGESTDKLFPGKITYIAPQISSTPDIGSSVAGRMIKGREITCTFDAAEVGLLPGQSVTIHLEKPGKFRFFSFGKK